MRTNFDKIFEIVKEILSEEIDEKGNYTRRGVVPEFSGIEVISLSLRSECLGIDSKNYFFSRLQTE